MAKTTSSRERLPQDQPEKFFAEARDCLRQLHGIPLVAVEALKVDEDTREVIIDIIRICVSICKMAGFTPSGQIKKKQEVKRRPSLREFVDERDGVTLETLKRNGYKLAFNKDGPIVVPDDGDDEDDRQ